MNLQKNKKTPGTLISIHDHFDSYQSQYLLSSLKFMSSRTFIISLIATLTSFNAFNEVITSLVSIVEKKHNGTDFLYLFKKRTVTIF